MSNQGSDEKSNGEGSAARRARDKKLVADTRKDNDSYAKLYAAWIDDIYDLALASGLDSEGAAEAAEVAFTKAWNDVAGMGDGSDFGAVLLRHARNAISPNATGRANYPASARRKKDSAAPEDTLSRATKLESVQSDENVAGVLRDASQPLAGRTRDILDLHFRHDLTAEEAAAVLGTSPDTVRETARKLPAAYAALVRSRLLWRGGKPEHDELATKLQEAGGKQFDAKAVRVINEHVKTCEKCRARGMVALQPIDAYSAIPIVTTPDAIRNRVTDKLKSAGVPVVAGVKPAGVDPKPTEADGEGKPKAEGKPDKGAGKTVAAAAGAAAGAALADKAVAATGGDDEKAASKSGQTTKDEPAPKEAKASKGGTTDPDTKKDPASKSDSGPAKASSTAAGAAGAAGAGETSAADVPASGSSASEKSKAGDDSGQGSKSAADEDTEKPGDSEGSDEDKDQESKGAGKSVAAGAASTSLVPAAAAALEKEAAADEGGLPAWGGLDGEGVTAKAPASPARKAVPVVDDDDDYDDEDEEAAKRKRMMYIGGGVAAAVILLLVIFALTRGGGDTQQVATSDTKAVSTTASRPSQTSPEATARASTTTTTEATTTTSTEDSTTSSSESSTSSSSSTSTPPGGGGGGSGGGGSGGGGSGGGGGGGGGGGSGGGGGGSGGVTTTTRPSISFSVTPETHKTPYEMARPDTPVVRWSVLSSDSLLVSVTGPNNFNQTSLAGGVSVCPVPLTSGTCTAPSGSFTYVLTVKAADGTVIDSQSKTLFLNS